MLLLFNCLSYYRIIEPLSYGGWITGSHARAGNPYSFEGIYAIKKILIARDHCIANIIAWFVPANVKIRVQLLMSGK